MKLYILVYQSFEATNSVLKHYLKFDNVTKIR